MNECHHRRSIRLRGYDYREAGAYFVTVCTANRECFFAEIVDEAMELNRLGEIVEDEWHRTAILRPQVSLDAFVVMPNHVHGIICFDAQEEGKARLAPTTAGSAIRLLDRCLRFWAHSNRPAQNGSTNRTVHVGRRSGNAIISTM